MGRNTYGRNKKPAIDHVGEALGSMKREPVVQHHYVPKPMADIPPRWFIVSVGSEDSDMIAFRWLRGREGFDRAALVDHMSDLDSHRPGTDRITVLLQVELEKENRFKEAGAQRGHTLRFMRRLDAAGFLYEVEEIRL